MSQHFSSLKARFGLPEEASSEALLAAVEQRLKQAPEDLELIYLRAELLRIGDHRAAARDGYQQVIKHARQQSDGRHQQLGRRLAGVQQRLRYRLLLYPLLIILLSIVLLIARPGGESNQGGEYDSPFVRWLAEQQAQQIISIIQSQGGGVAGGESDGALVDPWQAVADLIDPVEASGGESGSGGSDQSDEPAEVAAGDEGSGRAFHCSVEPLICQPDEVPSGSGDYRHDVADMLNAYEKIIAAGEQCEKLVQLVARVNRELQWRKSERELKAYLEESVVLCFYKQHAYSLSARHAHRMSCAGFDVLAASGYSFQTVSRIKLNDRQGAARSQQCANEYNDHLAKKIRGFHRVNVALNYSWIANAELFYFQRPENALRFYRKALQITQQLSKKSRSFNDVRIEIRLGLLGLYSIKPGRPADFNRVVDYLRNSGGMTSSQKVIVDGLTAIWQVRSGQQPAARHSLATVINRVQQLDEYVCLEEPLWEWGLYLEQLQVAEPARTALWKPLVEALDCQQKSLEQRVVLVKSAAASMEQP